MTALATHPLPARPRTAGPRVLADLLGGTRAREIALVLAGTALVVLAGRASIPLPFTPVPLTLGTLGVMGVATLLGPGRALASTGLYLALGVAGAPVFAGGGSGWAFASFGYILGFVAAATLLGFLARRGGDRRVWTMAASGAAATVLVHVFGLAWMVPFLGIGFPRAVELGVVPFLLGDALKVAFLAGAVPAVWRLSRDRRPGARGSAE